MGKIIVQLLTQFCKNCEQGHSYCVQWRNESNDLSHSKAINSRLHIKLRWRSGNTHFLQCALYTVKIPSIHESLILSGNELKGALSIKVLKEPSKSRIPLSGSGKRTYSSHWWKLLRICVSRVEEKVSSPKTADLLGCKCCFIPILYIGRVTLPKILLIKKLTQLLVCTFINQLWGNLNSIS